MNPNDKVVNRKHALSQLMKLAKILRDLMLLVLAADFLRHQVWKTAPKEPNLLITIEHWHLWAAIAVYMLTLAIWFWAAWQNRARVGMLFRRLQNTYDSFTV